MLVNRTKTRAFLRAIIAASVAFLLLATRPGLGVVIDTLSGTGNTSAPGNDPGWSNVGFRGIGTGVYLGNRWVLTANHVGGGDIVLGSGTYSMLAGSGQQLTNGGAAGKSTSTDLYLYQIDRDPGLPALAISATTPANTTAVTMIGGGLDRGAWKTWQLNTAVSPWTWTETNVSPNAAGYALGSSRTMRWGTNAISGTGWANIGGLDVSALQTAFNYSGVYSSEAQAATGDSGGAVFMSNGSGWELAGIMLATGAYSGQPANTAVFGNITYIADLSTYRTQIVQVVPEPGSVWLAIAGLATAGLAGMRRRRIGRPARFGEGPKR